MPGRGGVSHHPRRPFGAMLSLGAFTECLLRIVAALLMFLLVRKI